MTEDNELKQLLEDLKLRTINEIYERILDPECPPALFSVARGLLKDNEGAYKDQPPTIESLLNNLDESMQTDFKN